MSAKTRRALARLLSLIQTGYEFPSAVEHVQLTYRLTGDQVRALEAAYDSLH